MAEDKLLTIRDVALLLGISEKEVMDLAEKGTIPAYKVGGVYLRFKRQQIDEFRKSFAPLADKGLRAEKEPLSGRIKDFFYFNDFYMLSFLLIALLIFIILKGH